MENSAILRQWFDRVDSDKTGSITAPQLKSALAVGNLDFPLSIVQQMIRMYDFDKNGTMSFGEFVALTRFLIKAQQAFAELERDRGYLGHDEVYKALVKLGFTLDTPAFYTVCESSFESPIDALIHKNTDCLAWQDTWILVTHQSFDQDKTGKFQLDDFISLCIFLQSARNLFNSFDTAKQGRVTLDLNQFIYCTANCRI